MIQVKPSPDSIPNAEEKQSVSKKVKMNKVSDSVSSCGNEESDKSFQWLISPFPVEKFLRDTWEKKPLHIEQRGEKYYSGIFSCADFDRMLRNNHLEYNKNIDIVTYSGGKRYTVNPDGRAYAAVIWDYYQNGHSIRLLNPQTYSRPIWKLCSLLQEYFGSFVGVNMYLTPPGSQGFAPHYDDIEAFILQLEGKKHWKLYRPLKESDVLPRYSSRDFTDEEIGEPVFEVELNPGDLLYFPRGVIHQANTSESEHSMHITLSTYQKNTWGDLLQQILPKAIEAAMDENIEYRESLPRNYINYMGIANTDKDCTERKAFINKVTELTKGLSKYLLGDTGADLMAKDFIHSSLPPCLSQNEKSTSVHGNGECWKDGKVCNIVELQPDSEIRFIRKRAVSLMREEGCLRLYHSFENSRVFQERDPQYIGIGWEFFPAVELLMNSHPNYVPIDKLPLQNLEEQMDLAMLLYDKGVIQTRIPLTEDSDD